MTAKHVVIGLGILIALRVVDGLITAYADHRIRSRPEVFEQAIDDIQAYMAGLESVEDAEFRICEFRYELWVYPWQLCWRKLSLRATALEDLRYALYYSEPLPRLALFRGDHPDNYYFRELALGESLAIVSAQNVLVEGFGREMGIRR